MTFIKKIIINCIFEIYHFFNKICCKNDFCVIQLLTMSSLTLTLSGNSSQLKSDYFPPIELGDVGEYECGLIDFYTFNSIPNIDKATNLFHYHVGIELDRKNIYYKPKYFEIPTGSYEIDDLIQVIRNLLQENNKKIPIDFKLKVKKTTLQCEIFCSQPIDFTQKNSIGSLLGFDGLLDPNEWHTSNIPVNITGVNAVRIECNITGGAYINNRPANTIHEFYPTVSAGYKIVEVPRNVIYLPVIARTIHSLHINIVDQNNLPVNFRGEVITVRIHIKRKK